MVITYPVSIGKMDWTTPLGETHVISKQKHPIWYPTESVRKEHIANGDPLPKFVPSGPDNPLGDYAMRLAVGNGTYLMHGTNNPMAVGMAITHGCIRMYPEDVAALFPLVPVGTKVWLVNESGEGRLCRGRTAARSTPAGRCRRTEHRAESGPAVTAARQGTGGQHGRHSLGPGPCHAPGSGWHARRGRTTGGSRSASGAATRESAGGEPGIRLTSNGCRQSALTTDGVAASDWHR